MLQKNNFIILFVLLFFTQLICQGQESCHLHFEAEVLDKATKQSLPFSIVEVQELKSKIQTDEKGFFQIKDLCEGPYTFIISHIGSVSDTIRIILKSDIHKDFFLVPSEIALGELQIRDKKKSEILNSNSNKLNQYDLDRKSGENLGTILKQLPGLNTLSTGTGISKPVVTGLHSIRVITINDGVRLEGQQWGSEHAPEIDPNTAGQIQVEKGAGALQYSGEAIGGVIIVKPPSLRSTPGWNAYINSNISSVNLRGGISGMFEGQFAKTPGFSWRLQGTFMKAGNTKTPTYYLKNTGYQEQDFSASANYHKNKIKLHASYKIYQLNLGIFAGSHIGNLTDLLTAFQSEEPIDKDRFRYQIALPSQKINHHTASMGMGYLLNTKNKLDIDYSYQFNKRQEFDKILGREENKPAIEFYLNTHSGDINWRHENANSSYISNIGCSGFLQNNYYAGSYFIPEYGLQNIGVFSIHKITVKLFTLEAGVRFDSKWQHITRMKQLDVDIRHNWMGLSANLGILYQFDSHLSFDAQIGTSWRAPHAVELYSEGVHHGAAAFEKGNSNLGPERVYNTAINMTYSEGKLYQAEVTVYNKYIKNYIYLQPRTKPVLTIRGAFPAFDYKQTDANFLGTDIFFRIKLSNAFDISEKASILFARDLLNKNFLPFIPPNRFENSIGYTLPIHSRLDDVRIELNTTYVTRQNLADDNQDLVPAPKAYFLIGFAGELQVKTKKEPIQVFMSIDNLFNKKYRDYMNRWRYFADEAGTNFSIRVKIPFSSKDL